MTITDLVPLQTPRQRAVTELLGNLGDCLHHDGIPAHEHAVQTVARAAGPVAPGACAALSDRATPEAVRERAFGVAARVVAQCGDQRAHLLLTGALARYRSPRPTAA